MSRFDLKTPESKQVLKIRHYHTFVTACAILRFKILIPTKVIIKHTANMPSHMPVKSVWSIDL